ncbi:MAG: transcriptional regulator [Myxococcaceae bacterium]|nr:transcriptional regulator [Myxococcaceae bacterium]
MTHDCSRDLAWLLLRNGQRLQAATDRVALAHGLAGGLRDYVVLVLLQEERPRTQVELGQRAGLDKTTLMAALDRLERAGLVERQLDPGNRRVRIPTITPAGSTVREAIADARRAAEAVPGMTAKELQTLRKLLARLDRACEAAGMKSTGSCV